MLKTSYTQDNKELKMWVDPNNGSLNVSIEGETVSVPEQYGHELIQIIKQKQSLFYEEQRRKLSFWTKFSKYLNLDSQRYYQTV